MTGLNCGNPAGYTTALITNHLNITWEQLMWIGIAVVVHIILIILFVTCRSVRSKRTRMGANNINNETRKQIVLNSARPNDGEYKRSSKLSNLEVVQVSFNHISFLKLNIETKFKATLKVEALSILTKNNFGCCYNCFL